jgi:putative ABC transport system permease protein
MEINLGDNVRLFDYISTAFRNLWRQKSRSALTIVAIVIGAMVIILVASLSSSAKAVFRAQLEAMGGLSLITVSPNAEFLQDQQGFFANSDSCTGNCKKMDNSTVTSLKSLPNVADVSPSVMVSFNKMQLKEGGKKRWASFTGLEAGTKVVNIPIVAGRDLQKGDIGNVVLGMDTLRTWGYADKPKDIVGKKIIVLAQGWYSGWGVAEIPKPPMGDNKDFQKEMQEKIYEIEMNIVGVTSSPTTDGQNFITLDFARELSVERRWEFKENKEPYLKTSNRIDDNGYNLILVKASTPDNVTGIADQIEKMGFGTTTSREALADFMNMLTGLTIILSVIGGIALFVAGIGIINTMIMSMYERTYEIGVMRACGATRATIRRLFTFESALIGFWGGVFGLVLCYGLAKIANHYIAIYLPKMGVTANIALTFPLWLILATLAFTSFIGMLAGIYPAIRAAKLDPVEALRYE